MKAREEKKEGYIVNGELRAFTCFVMHWAKRVVIDIHQLFVLNIRHQNIIKEPSTFSGQQQRCEIGGSLRTQSLRSRLRTGIGKSRVAHEHCFAYWGNKGTIEYADGAWSEPQF
jgi:hypothetical protein